MVHRALILGAALLIGCPAAPGTTDDDDSTEDTSNDDDASRDDDDTLDDDDLEPWPRPPGCPALDVHITRAATVPPVVDAMKLRIGAYRVGDVDTSSVPRAPELASNTFHGLGPLLAPDDSYSVPLCVPDGELVIGVMLDVNWDDDTCTPGDLLGYGQGLFADGGDVIDVLLDHVLTEADCVH